MAKFREYTHQEVEEKNDLVPMVMRVLRNEGDASDRYFVLTKLKPKLVLAIAIANSGEVTTIKQLRGYHE